jgi:transcriptional regulator with XRE-family HTH domain
MSVLYALVKARFSCIRYNEPMPRLPKEKRPSVIPVNQLAIGERLAKLRKIAGLTQKELAEKIGVTRTVITDYECGRVRIYDEMLARLANVLHTSADAILGIGTSKAKDAPSLRISKRINDLEKLPEQKKKAILKTLDDLIKANS